MKKFLFTLVLSISCLVTFGKPTDDSVFIFPKPAKNYINVINTHNDSTKYDIFLFKKDGHLLKSTIKDSQLIVNDIPSGEYVLEVFDDKNKYRFFILVEN